MATIETEAFKDGSPYMDPKNWASDPSQDTSVYRRVRRHADETTTITSPWHGPFDPPRLATWLDPYANDARSFASHG